MTDWKVGQDATVTSGGERRILKVARVLKRFVELEDGSLYGPDGYPYPRPRRGYHRGNTCRPTDAQDREYVARAAAIRALEKLRGPHGEWSGIPSERLLSALQKLT